MATKDVNSKSPTIRRILKEAQELASTPSPDFYAAPIESDLFSWHFTIRGPPSSPYESGIYHGRIVLPPTYPLRPPSFRFMTPCGRFEVNREICLSISGHHEETWMPAWGVRTAMLALRSFMEQPSEGQVGGMDMDDQSRRKLADQSIKWKCEECGHSNEEILKESAEAAEKLEGGRKLEDKVPEELKMGYKEDIEKKPKSEESADGPEAKARKARADAAIERAAMMKNRGSPKPWKKNSEDAEKEARTAAARATLARVGVSAQGGYSTPPAPTREDSEEIARIAAMFPPAAASPIPRGYQSPNQLEPMVGNPPPIYSRPIAQPGQAAAVPTGSSTTSFQDDAYPPYLDHPQPRRPSTITPRVDSPLTANEFLRETRQAGVAESPHECNANLPPDLVRAQADAAARYFESIGANMHMRQRPMAQLHPYTQEQIEERQRAFDNRNAQQVAAPAYGQQNGNGQAAPTMWIDRLIVALVALLGVTIVRFIYIQTN